MMPTFFQHPKKDSKASNTHLNHQTVPAQNETLPDNEEQSFDIASLNASSILQLQRLIGNQAVVRLTQSDKAIQRVFQPATTGNGTTKLRAVGNGAKLGNNIPANTKVVVDPAVTRTTNSGFRNRTVNNWTRAINIRPENWNSTTDKTQGGYIRSNKIVLENYPKAVTPQGRRTRQAHWHENIGMYELLSDDDGARMSIEGGGKRLIQGVFSGEQFTLDAGGTVATLSDRETSGVGVPERRAAARERLRVILGGAAAIGGLNPGLLATDENLNGLLKPLRVDTFQSFDQGVRANRWYDWVQGVYAKIQTGATEVVGDILHWRSTIYPPDATACQITKVEIEGSDLHDRGLGALFVTYEKPNDANGMFPNVASVKVVIKPENRNIEKALFGSQPNSLANTVNRLANLTDDEAINTIKMETHANHGSLIEFVNATRAKDLVGDSQPATDALTEGIAFAFLAGMSDVHQENVLWKDGKPYFIDADNSLTLAKLRRVDNAQSGFTKFNRAHTQQVADTINNNPGASTSKIIQALMADARPFAQAIRNMFIGGGVPLSGRIVPIYTNHWADKFKVEPGYITAPVGNQGDAWNPVDNQRSTNSRWAFVNEAIGIVENGQVGAGPGLAAEAGTSTAGRTFNRDVEKAQIKADLDLGKIPFYSYHYMTGEVKHNDQVIWHGQTVDDAIQIILTKFPPPHAL